MKRPNQDDLNSIREHIRPRFNELACFLTALVCVLALLTHSSALIQFFSITEDPAQKKTPIVLILLWGLLASVGLALSLYHVFTRRRKSAFEKTWMAVFVLLANGVAGLAAGLDILPAGRSLWWMLLPLWNTLTGLFTIYVIGLVDLRKVIADEDVEGYETLLGAALLLAAFFAADLGLMMPWNMTFSLCVSLAPWLAFGLLKFRPFFNRLQPLPPPLPVGSPKRHR